MKKKYFIILILFIVYYNNASAQISLGPKVGLGAGTIRSGNLQKNLDVQKSKDLDISEWDVSNRPGLLANLGFFVQYDLMNKIAIQTELSYSPFSSKIKIDYEERNLDNAGNGDVTSLLSEAKLKTSFLSLPVMIKYTFKEEPNLYGIIGFSFNFLGRTSINSEEERVKDDYQDGIITKSTTDIRRISSDIDVFNFTRTNFLFGVGTTIKVANKDLELNLRYNLPLTKSEMYTSSIAFDDQARKNNEVFGVNGKLNAEKDAPGYPINDYKMGFLEVTANYTLFKK